MLANEEKNKERTAEGLLFVSLLQKVWFSNEKTTIFESVLLWFLKCARFCVGKSQLSEFVVQY